MAITSTESVNSATTSNVIPMDADMPFGSTAQVSGTFVGTYSVEGTLDKDVTVATWFAVPNGAALTAPGMIAIPMPLSGIRLNVTAYTSGTVTLKVLQGSGI